MHWYYQTLETSAADYTGVANLIAVIVACLVMIGIIVVLCKGFKCERFIGNDIIGSFIAEFTTAEIERRLEKEILGGVSLGQEETVFEKELDVIKEDESTEEPQYPESVEKAIQEIIDGHDDSKIT